MSSEQTWLSKKLSPVIEEYEVADAILIGAALLTAAAFFTPAIHPVAGIAIAWGTHLTLSALGFYEKEGRSPMKNGRYTEIEEAPDYTTCNDCGNRYKKKRGYKMLYLLGYEMFRVEQFFSEECEECELESPEEQGERDAERVKELA